MKRKQPSRSKRTAKKSSEPPAPQGKRKRRKQEAVAEEKDAEPKDSEQRAPEAGLSSAGAGGGRRAPVGVALALMLIAVVCVYCGLVVLYFSLRVRADVWPTLDDVRLDPSFGAVEVAVLLLACLLAWVACRAAYRSKKAVARVCLLGAVVLGGLTGGLRWHQYQELYSDGLWQRSLTGPIYERANLYYVQAVKFRLAELFGELDDRANLPNEFTDEDAQNLEIVGNLQQNMVNWTEHEVGHWSEDLQQRRDLMRLIAYQVLPLSQDRESMLASVQQQLRELDRQKQWFEVMEDYCEGKRELMKSSAKKAPEDVVGSSLPPSSLEQLNRKLQTDLESLGLDGWSYAQSVMLDGANQAMAGERANQVAARLQAIRLRKDYLVGVQQSVTEGGYSGLNREFRWLRLPVCLPGGNAWAGGFFALSGTHMLLLGFTVFLSIVGLVFGSAGGRGTLLRHVQWWWLVTATCGATFYLLFYLR